MTIVRILLAAAGLLIAAFASMLALGIAGGGHGWITPFFFSLALVPAYPVVLLRLTALGPRWFVVDLALAALAGIADAALYFFTIREGTEYFWRVVDAQAWAPLLWLAIWFAWQPIALYCLWRDRAAAAEVGAS
jgi:hypothetical protein